ncbi:Fructose dehydrogenase large subunit [compost metagenome]
MRTIAADELPAHRYDVVIIGAGIGAAMLARVLSARRRRILLVEAGTGDVERFSEFEDYLRTFYRALAKIPNSPFPTSANAPQPLETDVRPIAGTTPSTVGWFVQTGPKPFESTYARRTGGTTLHWFGSCPRMLPEDFAMRRRFGAGEDWPLAYDDLMPFYASAEEEIGVSADVEDQAYAHIRFAPGYVYPMHRIPPSWLDQWFRAGLHGMRVHDGHDERQVEVISIPQARNSIPNERYDGGRGYRPVGAAGNQALGHRCQGNSSCIPICPIQARYSALKTLSALPDDYVHLLPRAVASRLRANPESGRIDSLMLKVWQDDRSPAHRTVEVGARIFVAAANAIENAVLLLASGLAGRSGQLGRNLMDHPAILSWGLAPEPIGAFRGPGLTSTIPTFRSGAFRAERAAFVFEIGNWGWSWPRNEPTDTVAAFVDSANLYGARLRQRAEADMPRQVRVDMMTEQLPSAANQVSIDPAFTDALGNYRPVIRYGVDNYTQAGLVFGRSFAQRVFRRLGIEDFTVFPPGDPGFFTHGGAGFVWSGVGHVAGTHRMGTSAAHAVVDHRQKSWEHDNLYIVGCGSMPTLGTSNPTLTMSALNLRTAGFIDRDLDGMG